MRTANNNSDFTVEALVAKYRNFVEDHASYDFIGADADFIGSMEYGLDGWPDHQLLITLYNDVAGDKADPNILNRLSKYGEHFWKDVLDAEEYTFLRENFKDAVDYIFSKGLHYGSDATRNSVYMMMGDKSFIKTAAKYITAKPGDYVYLENDTLGDGAVLFPSCIILCDDKDNDESAIKKIRLFAAGIQYRNLQKIEEETIDIIVSGAGWFPGFLIPSETLYASLADNGTMIMQAHPHFMTSLDKDAVSFRKRLVADKSIKTIIKYSQSDTIFRYVITIEKKEHSEVDVQDRVSQQSMMVDFEKITPRILLPGYYLTERPDNGRPLSDFLENYDFNHVSQSVSIEQPIVFPQSLGTSFKDADISLKSLKKGTEYGLTSDNPASNCYNVDFQSILLYGGKKTVYAGIVPKVKLPYAVLDPIACFTAKDGVDLRYVASLLFDPIVAKQISAIYMDFYYGNMMVFMPEFLRNIIVPNHDSNERNKYLADTCYEALYNSQIELKQENEFYRKAIRMRKHALTQPMSAIKDVFDTLNEHRIENNGTISNNERISPPNETTVRDAFELIARSLEDIMPALDHIADIDYSYSKPEWIDPEIFIEDYIEKNKKGWITFNPIMTWEKGNNQAKEDIFGDNPETGRKGRLLFAKGESLDLFLFPKDALTRVFNNIVANAQAHGFTDKKRSDYQLRFSWHVDGLANIIEIENNGTAIPADRDTSTLLEYGVSTALHHEGHNGIGCNEIDDIMRRYDGKVEIVSSPENEFTVKYVLTFNRINNVRNPF